MELSVIQSVKRKLQA